MAGQWHGGKGSKPRPFSVPVEEFGNSHTRIFGEKKKYCSSCGKTFSWCQCKPNGEDNTGTDKNEYQDILSTEDAVLDELEQYRKQAQELWSDSCTTPRKK